ncbi:major facilitator superfamily domain-containing protein 12-like [Pogonomyrmex barbatus]|uniref:Major facilitator superfamily domain-containing protein 12-like n=1 Tax=Pogonomyrmex barbatus TaxID=144034 RepID=A0A6I9W6I2_9HYME|nr:major facilitator superfamily domain-containing protein 12-like [Pogonomyrmex barbatus]XP_011637628.1 major facilitator superfamily domain-containing protein 12-like [Pogonomyrmex barbatus]XP_011637629.1 major facilitator superfamily domain-containing protein 12-like [Pogonomyrmex barbatus]XP_011637631.1 major facilitator superfamily domain-containing protein 12-like [Pogonomyrmex barbatus]XP_011637632.1 major facilitator superfamily domain-containing protein 12-like [Pogonomyrmex barbatus]
MDNERMPLVDTERIATSTKFAYALGHVFNDLAAAMWFSYTLIYLQRVALLEPVVAGALLLLGQIVDAIMTPIFGFLVDRYCKKKIWHVIGSIIVTLSFPIIFGGFANSSITIAVLLYVTSITIFQIGWAAVQISHLSMIPSLTNSVLARADLTAIRYSAQVGAAVIVFIVTWIVLPTSGELIVQLDQQDDYKFRNISLVLTALGLTATVFFHIFLKANLLEQTTSAKANIEEPTKSSDLSPNRRISWIGITILLRVAMLYVASRLFITLATVYLPLYIEETKVDGKQALATVPLVSYVSSFVAALLLKYITRICGTKACYLLGAIIGIIAAIVTEFVGNSTTIVYLVAVLIGAGSSITMVTALSVTAELIGSRTERSAFVYSIVTFLDKIITGLVVILIEQWRCKDKELCPNYNRDTLSIVCVSSMILGLITLLSVSRCLT